MEGLHVQLFSVYLIITQSDKTSTTLVSYTQPEGPGQLPHNTKTFTFVEITVTLDTFF